MSVHIQSFKIQELMTGEKHRALAVLYMLNTMRNPRTAQVRPWANSQAKASVPCKVLGDLKKSFMKSIASLSCLTYFLSLRY
jgi:hypothetical protein